MRTEKALGLPAQEAQHVKKPTLELPVGEQHCAAEPLEDLLGDAEKADDSCTNIEPFSLCVFAIIKQRNSQATISQVN